MSGSPVAALAKCSASEHQGFGSCGRRREAMLTLGEVRS